MRSPALAVKTGNSVAHAAAVMLEVGSAEQLAAEPAAPGAPVALLSVQLLTATGKHTD